VALGAIPLVVLGCASGGRLARGPEPTISTYAQRLLERRCNGCHDTPRPAEMPRQRWLDGLARMQRRIKLPPADWDTLTTLAQPEARAVR
jgi:hypothetical protein